MKKLILSVLAVAGMLVAMTTIHACSSDEADEQNLSQAQLLMQKSKEFAQKYGVDMTLNEENIKETAKTLTVEQMEKDYQEWAELTKNPIEMKVTGGENKTKNKIKLRRRISEMELSGQGGNFSGRTSFGNIGNIWQAEVLVNWKYHTAVNHTVRAEVTCLSPKGNSYNTKVDLSSSFNASGDFITFSAWGTFKLTDTPYNKELTLHVFYNEQTQEKTISLS